MNLFQKRITLIWNKLFKLIRSLKRENKRNSNLNNNSKKSIANECFNSKKNPDSNEKQKKNE